MPERETIEDSQGEGAGNMCPKRSEQGNHGKKIEEHVSEKERTGDLREEDRGTCARKGAERGFTGRRWSNMCPKRSGEEIYGKKIEQHVPEKERRGDLREEDGATCSSKWFSSVASYRKWY